jgi:hypothetical protein
MEQSANLVIDFGNNEKESNFTDLVNGYHDMIWKVASQDLAYKNIQDVSNRKVDYISIFKDFLPKLQLALNNNGIEENDATLFSKCTASSNKGVVSLSIETDSNIDHLLDELIFMPVTSRGKIVNKKIFKE